MPDKYYQEYGPIKRRRAAGTLNRDDAPPETELLPEPEPLPAADAEFPGHRDQDQVAEPARVLDRKLQRDRAAEGMPDQDDGRVDPQLVQRDFHIGHDARHTVAAVRRIRLAVPAQVEGDHPAAGGEFLNLVVELDGVPAEAVLPGDGYTRYIRPFRTIEDTHVSAAILGHVLGVAAVFGWPRSLREDLLNLVVNLRAIGTADPSAPEIHVALGGFFNAYRTVLERAQPCWQGVPDELRARWERDRPLLDIAGNARAKRLEAAWRRILS